MALVTALERARQYLIFQEDATDSRLISAVPIATREFKKLFKGYYDALRIPETFTTTAVVEESGDYILCPLESFIIKRLSIGYELSVESGNYADTYKVEDIDTTGNKITLLNKSDFVVESITFTNEKRQIHEDALGWFICAYSTFSHQEIKELKVMITSTQVGEGSAEAYSVESINKFRLLCLKEGKKLLRNEIFPSGH